MKSIEVNGYYLPPGFREKISKFNIEQFNQKDTLIKLKVPMVTRAFVEVLADYLKKQREAYLAQLPIKKIIQVLDEASRLWLDPNYPPRQLALKTIPVVTGFSSEVVAASIDVEMESSLADDIWRTLEDEIINPLYLDDFQYSKQLDGFRRAFGPELMVSFFSENIPALPHLLFMRSALVKSACLGKVASGEPTFAPLYLKTIEDIDPRMAECMSVLYWRGGDEGVEDAAFNQADAVILFGGVEACNSLIERIPRRIRILIHGHKLGFGAIGKKRLKNSGLDRLAKAVAYDHAMFDQQACLAPHVYYLESGGEVTPEKFAQKVADAMAVMQTEMPRGFIDPGAASAINQLRAKYEMQELKGKAVRMWASSGGTEWTVIYEKDPGIFRPSPLNRFIRIWEVADIFQIRPRRD
ncbi:MAG: hypothetical protein MUP22_03445, partial [Desulfobacterales bacterium]|nr:hypothetical protein [Desulfobacterales bacterium]